MIVDKPEIVLPEIPDEVREAMKQNERILAMNELIIQVFCTPPMVHIPDDPLGTLADRYMDRCKK